MVILEDDVDVVTPDLCTSLADLLRRGILPTSWMFCYLGSHEHTRLVKRTGVRPKVNEVENGVMVAGGFAYIIDRRGAAFLDKNIFPLREQWDSCVGDLAWGALTRLSIGPKMRGGLVSEPLFSAPPSQEGECDSDVQRFDATARPRSTLPHVGKKPRIERSEALLAAAQITTELEHAWLRYSKLPQLSVASTARQVETWADRHLRSQSAADVLQGTAIAIAAESHFLPPRLKWAAHGNGDLPIDRQEYAATDVMLAFMEKEGGGDLELQTPGSMRILTAHLFSIGPHMHPTYSPPFHIHVATRTYTHLHAPTRTSPSQCAVSR